jgi:hypothetical protein
LRPDFTVNTSAGVASVSIRNSLLAMTDNEFEQLIRRSAEHTWPGGLRSAPIQPPFPRCRIVWHVNPGVSRGVSTLIVNVFDGSVPVAHEQEVVSNSAPMVTIARAIDSATSRIGIDHWPEC